MMFAVVWNDSESDVKFVCGLAFTEEDAKKLLKECTAEALEEELFEEEDINRFLQIEDFNQDLLEDVNSSLGQQNFLDNLNY